MEFLARGRFLGRHCVSPLEVDVAILPSPYISKTGGISRHVRMAGLYTYGEFLSRTIVGSVQFAVALASTDVSDIVVV
jgi:hypothetical protein